MTRSLLVSMDDVALRLEADALAACGYEVVACPGPAIVACPVLDGGSCPLAERADVLLYDPRSAAASRGDHTLLRELRSLYADKPVILADPDRSLPAGESLLGEGVWKVVGAPSPERLQLAIEEALGDR